MNIDQLFHQAIILHQSGRLADAENIYNQILRQKPKHPGALHHLGLIAQSRGNIPEAKRLISTAIKAEPRYAEAYNSLGTLEASQNNLKEAAQLFARAASMKPGYVQALINQARALLGLGHSREAKAICMKILSIDPKNPEIHTNLGIILAKEKDSEKAEAHFLKALELAPNMFGANLNLGSFLIENGQIDKGMQALRKALGIDSNSHQVYYNLGVGASKLKQFEQAIEYFNKASSLNPNLEEAWNNLGVIYSERGNLEEAEKAYRKALDLNPGNAEYWCNLGVVYKQAIRNDDAKSALGRALELNPNLHKARMVLANVLKYEGEVDKAIDEYLYLTDKDPDVANIWYNLGNAYLARGECTKAEEAYTKSFEIYPASNLTWRALLTSMLYNHDYSCDDLYARRLDVIQKLSPKPDSIRPEISSIEGRKLRIGYVSSDFRQHPVARNMIQILVNHDREKFEIYAYADVVRPDNMSKKISEHCNKWVNIAGLDDAKAAELIKEDKIDILVILASYFDFNRPLIACYRPAPLVVGMHDPASIGISEIDYLIGDVFLNPRNGKEKFSERVVRMPVFYLHEPIKEAPAISALPWEKNDFITFGCFNNPAKISDLTLSIWKNVLKEIPKSRLILKYMSVYRSQIARDRIIKALDSDRVFFIVGDNDINAHLDIYNQIDVALDPFPFSGSTTSFEAVYMGVPVITLAGETMVSRWTGMIEKALGLQDFIAHSPEEYCQIATNMDQEKLRSIRHNLRDKVENSSLCTVKRRARHLEMIYRAIIKHPLIN